MQKSANQTETQNHKPYFYDEDRQIFFINKETKFLEAYTAFNSPFFKKDYPIPTVLLIWDGPKLITVTFDEPVKVKKVVSRNEETEVLPLGAQDADLLSSVFKHDNEKLNEILSEIQKSTTSGKPQGLSKNNHTGK